MTISASFGIVGARRMTCASACAGSSAGMMPSRREQSLKASSASSSVADDVFDAAELVQPGMLGADAGVVEAGGDRVRLVDLAVRVLEQVGAVAVQHAGAAAGQRGGVLAAVEAAAGGFDAEHPDVGVVEEGEEQAHRVRAAADRGDQRVGEAAFRRR